MRRRAPPTRSQRAGTMTAPSFSASAAGAGVVMASRPKKGAGTPSLVFWSASSRMDLPARSTLKMRRVPCAPLAICSLRPLRMRCFTIQRSMKGLFTGR